MTETPDQMYHRHETWIQKKERGEEVLSAMCFLVSVASTADGPDF